jgi:hypothetical protein
VELKRLFGEGKSRDQIKAWLRFGRLVLRVFDWVDGRRRRAYDKAQLALRALFDSHSHSARIYTSKVKAFSYGTRLVFPQDPPSALSSLEAQ